LFDYVLVVEMEVDGEMDMELEEMGGKMDGDFNQ
jgi:hypothetical protein